MNTRRVRLVRRILLLFVAVLAIALYFGFVHRIHAHEEAAGWVLDMSYIPLRCRTCLGVIERLECNGKPVHVPPVSDADGSGGRIMIATPVGKFESFGGEGWRWVGGPMPTVYCNESVTQEDLDHGSYDASEGVERQRGTPAHWCLGMAAQQARWLDPGRLAEIDW